ncbi:hypothetical protein [Streptomyces sp. KL116D]|uniref:hypothetical protein n=1 Tax=Streptomyces sp. KL116D TaxID=3045152 RepID=UPI003558EC18
MLVHQAAESFRLFTGCEPHYPNMLGDFADLTAEVGAFLTERRCRGWPMFTALPRRSPGLFGTLPPGSRSARVVDIVTDKTAGRPPRNDCRIPPGA